MNRHKDHYNPHHTHYGDLDRHGNRSSSNQRNDTRSTYGAHAYGDYSSGTHYGEGGSTQGGGSSYGHSYYKGYSKQSLPDFSRRSGSQVSNQGRSGYERAEEREPRDYGSNDYSDFMNYNYGKSNRSERERPYNRNSGSGSGDSGRSNLGYDRGYSGYGSTGYGSTSYNNRDTDREREAYSRGSGRQEGYSNRGVPDYSTRNIGESYGAGRGDTYSSGDYGRSSGRYGEDMIRSSSGYGRYAAGSDRGGYVNKDPNY